MATEAGRLELVVDSDTDRAERGLKGIGDHVNRAGGFFKTAAASMVGFATGTVLIGGATAAFGALSDVVGGSISNALEAQEVQAKLTAVLKSTGQAAGVTAEAAIGLADSLSQVTKFDDETILSAENLMLTFTKVGKNVFPEAIETALNMSEAMGGDVKGSVIQLGKALQDPIRGISALTKVGVNFTDKQKEMIQKLVESGDVMGAQKVILNELGTEFKDQARAAGATLGGQLTILNNQFENVKEEIGNAFIPVLTSIVGAVRPIVSAFADALPGALQAFQGAAMPIFNQVWSNIQTNLIPAIQTLAKWFGDNVLPVIKTVATVFMTNVLPALQGVWNSISANLLPALQRLWAQLSPILIPTLQALGFVIQNVIGPVLGLLIAGIANVIDVIATVIGWVARLVAAIVAFVGQIGPAWTSFWNGVRTTLTNVWNAIIGAVQTAVNTVVGWFRWLYDHNTYIKQLVDDIRAKFTAIRDFIVGVWNGIANFLGGIWNAIRGAAVAAWEAFVSAIRGKVGESGAAANSIGDAIKKPIMDLAGKAVEWGKNLIQGFINGIKNMLGNLGKVAQDAAATVAKFLGFHSPAEEGPGKDADKWAANLMGMFTEGMESGLSDIRAVSQRIAGEVKRGLAVTGAFAGGGGLGVGATSAVAGGNVAAAIAPALAAGGGGGYRTANINIYMDGKVLARQLQQPLADEWWIKTGVR